LCLSEAATAANAATEAWEAEAAKEVAMEAEAEAVTRRS